MKLEGVYGHGKWTHSPDSILCFARNPSYIPRAHPVEITANQLRGYIQFFFFEYLEGLSPAQHQQLVYPDELLKHLHEDADTRGLMCGLSEMKRADDTR